MTNIVASSSVIGVGILKTELAHINCDSSPVKDESDTQLLKEISKGVYKATSDVSLIV